MTKYKKTTNALLGVAIGDALGVPFEFRTRLEMEKNPATKMIGNGTYNQLEGTWSDDSLLTFCLAESLVGGYDLEDMAAKFIAWKNKNYWTARGKVFDIGITTSKSISRLERMVADDKLEDLKLLKYQGDEFDNGNGSLMRIIPLLFFIKGKPIAEQFQIIRNVSALTHRHIRAAMCCLIYLRMAEHILNGETKEESYSKTRKEILAFWEIFEFAERERVHFLRIIQNDIRTVLHKDLKSGGYVMESLEASFWSFLKNDNYSDIVFEAINFGHDTDTTAAIVGGLAGIFYGVENIPEHWLISLARRKDIIVLGNKLHEKYFKNEV